MSTTKRTTFSAAVAAFALACCLAVVALAAAPSEAHAVNPPSKPTIASVKPYSKTKLTVNVKSVLDVMGYQVKYSPYKSFSSAKTVTTSSQKTAIRISNLKAHKKYYVKVRAYRLKGSTKVWGKWSTVKYGTTYQYSITYKLNGGTWGKVTPRYGFDKSSATFTLKTPKRAGYDFKGWYTSTAYKTKVAKIAKGTTKSKTLYAKWSKTPYTYTIKNGEFGTGAYVEYKGTATSLTVPKTIGGKDVVQLSCSYTSLTYLDVSRCTALKNLECANCKLTTLNVSGCAALQRIWASDNSLTTINVTKCPKLTHLWVGNNKLKSLNVSKNPSLLNLNILSNPITKLNVSRCDSLYDLYCKDVPLETLILRDGEYSCSNLVNLDCMGCKKLKSLDCSDLALKYLGVENCSALTFLDCSDNEIQHLEIAGCTSLADLRCDYNDIDELTFAYSPKLSYINCAHNLLTSLDVSSCPLMASSSTGNIMCDWTCEVTGCPSSVIEHP